MFFQTQNLRKLKKNRRIRKGKRGAETAGGKKLRIFKNYQLFEK